MNNKNDKFVKSAIKAFCALTAASSLITATNVLAADQATEKCYGIVKAGKNDCATAKASCAGSATKDSQGDAYLFLPQGTCEKIVGASLKPKEDTQKK